MISFFEGWLYNLILSCKHKTEGVDVGSEGVDVAFWDKALLEMNNCHPNSWK